MKLDDELSLAIVGGCIKLEYLVHLYVVGYDARC